MSYSDSVAVFKKRCLEIGLTEANFESFNAEGLNTMGTLAFSCNHAPGSADERPLVTLATKVLGAAPSTKEMACIRRLFSEAYSTIAADIRSKVEASDEAAVKKLAPAERSQGYMTSSSASLGWRSEEISNHEIRYVSWDVCVSRDHEIGLGRRRTMAFL